MAARNMGAHPAHVLLLGNKQVATVATASVVDSQQLQ